MAHSPYQTNVYPPIRNLAQHREILACSRDSYDDRKGLEDGGGDLLETGEALLKHCDFLARKLEIKVRVPSLLMVWTSH